MSCVLAIGKRARPPSTLKERPFMSTPTATSIQDIQAAIGDYGKDIRVNLENVLAEEGAPGLTPTQQWSVALASAYALQNPAVVSTVQQLAQRVLPAEAIEA